jgi:ABC-type lipoprotein release transport system permease subunit
MQIYNFFKKEIFLIFLFEGFFIGILGSIGGILLGTILGIIINFSGGIYMSSPPGHTEGYYILINLHFYSFFISFLVCTVSSTIAGTFGAIKAYKLKIINAINYV